MAARAAWSLPSEGTVSRSVRWPRALVAMSRPAGMVANQPIRTARRAADLQPTGPAGIPLGHADHDPGDGVEGSVPLIQSQDQPRQLRSRVGRPGPPAASSSMRAERSGCRHSRGLDDGVKLIAVRRSVAAGMACPSRT